ncbi:MAG: copper-binding protein [Deltaproteobacteria bacterium]|nr:copper-binding protein [Deltaproteobacteria bacterium]
MRVELARTIAAVALVLVLGGAPGCSGGMPGGKLYPIRGEVVSITAARNEIVMQHEPIAGFMQGMTMPFPVAKRDLLEGIEPGDRVEGVLLVEGARYALVSLAEIAKGTPVAAESDS